GGPGEWAHLRLRRERHADHDHLDDHHQHHAPAPHDHAARHDDHHPPVLHHLVHHQHHSAAHHHHTDHDHHLPPDHHLAHHHHRHAARVRDDDHLDAARGVPHRHGEPELVGHTGECLGAVHQRRPAADRLARGGILQSPRQPSERAQLPLARSRDELRRRR